MLKLCPMDSGAQLGGQQQLDLAQEEKEIPQQKRVCGLLCESCKKSEAQVLELETNQVFCHACHNRVKKENSKNTKKTTTQMKGREVSGKAGVSGPSVDYSLFNDASRDKGDVLLGSKANELMSTISCQNYLALQGEGQAAHFSKENAESEQRSNSSKQSSSSQVQYMYDPRCQGQFPPHLIFNSCVKMQQQQPLLPEGKGASYNDHAEKARARRNQQKFKASSCSPKLSFRMHQQQESLLPPVTQYSQTCTAIRHKDGTYEWLEVNVSSDRSCDTIMSGQLSTEGRSSPMSIMNSLNKKIQSKKARDASLHRKGALARYKKKKENRKFTKKIRYESRKERADKRIRIRGRFAKVHN